MSTDYWKECVQIAADECGLVMTDDQLDCIAGAVESSHENYGMAFYSPPASDRIHELDREHNLKLRAMKAEHEQFRKNAETAIRQSLKVRHGDPITIGEDGEVFRHGGRTERIQ